jgi:hypothetical protein
MTAFKPTPTREGDTFETLFNAYRGAFPAGTTLQSFVQQLLRANNVRYSTPAIEAWIFGLSGKRFPFNPKNNPGMYGGPKNVGWAYFGEGNIIQLPDFPRPGATPPPSNAVAPPPEKDLRPLVVRDSNVMFWVLAGGAALWLFLLSKKGKKT